jgi:uncharacterized linocin/CFP29 family protein
MNDNHGRDKLWNPQIWSEIDRIVMADMGRVRVAQKVFAAQFTPHAPTVSMDVVIPRQNSNDPLMIQEGVALPFFEISSEFALTQNQVDNEAELHKGLTLARACARTVAMVEDMVLLQGAQAPLPSGVRVTNLTSAWNGLVDLTSGLTPIVVPSLEGGGFGANTFTAISQGIGNLIVVGHPGPYALILETSVFADTYAPAPNTLTTTADRISPLVEGRFFGTGMLPANTGLLISLGGETTTLYLSQEATTVFTQQDHMGNYHFRVFERVQINVRDPQAFVTLQFQSSQSRQQPHAKK